MHIEIGNPGAGTTVVVDLEGLVVEEDLDGVARRVVTALNVLKTAGDTWVEWSRDHETPEQAEMRELMERNGELKKRALQQQNVELEAMLEGTTDGIGPIGRKS